MVQYPTIHLNGTSAKTLQDELRKAENAVREAIVALTAMTVHGRDYYVKADKTAFTQAQSEHRARIAALEIVRRDLVDMWQGVTDQT